MSLSVRLFGDRGRAQELVGEAKRRLALLKQSMGFQGLKQLSLPAISLFDGSTIMVKSIFGIDIIEVVGAGGVVMRQITEITSQYFIFLITSDTSYAIWKVKDKGAVVVSNKLNINKYALNTTSLESFYKYPALYKNPSVVKSNKELGEHFYTIESIRTDIKYFHRGAYFCVPQYGRHMESLNLPGGDKTVLVGIRNCFIKGSFDSDTDYVTLPLGPTTAYICSGRNSSYTDENEGLIKDLELLYIGSTSGRIRYNVFNKESMDWELKLGVVITFASRNDIYAVLSPTKFIKKLRPTESGIYQDYVWGCGWNTAYKDGKYYLDYTFGYLEDKYSFIFGDEVIEDKLGEMYQFHGWRTGLVCKTLTILGRPYCYYLDTQFRLCFSAIREQWGQNDGEVRPLDYDNVGTDSFVLLYQLYLDITSYIWHPEWRGTEPDCQSPSGSWDADSLTLCTDLTFPGGDYLAYDWAKKYEYKLTYKTSAESPLVKVSLCKYMTGLTSIWVGHPDKVIYSFGSRVSKVSTRVTDKYILYTYIISDYSGPDDEDHINDEDDTYWSYNKRILGIVDIKSGLRTEHEVDDSLLGDLYKDTFDKTASSALGLHMIKKEQTYEAG